MCGWPHTHFLPLCVWCEGVSTLGLPCTGGQRAEPGNRWWWLGGRAAGHRGSEHSKNAADPVASAGWEQAKSWCRVFLLHWNKHCISLLEGKVAPTAQCWWKMERSQLLGCCSSTWLKSIANMLSLLGYILVMVAWLLFGAVDWQDYLATLLHSLLTVFWHYHGHTSLRIALQIDSILMIDFLFINI